MPRWRLAGVIVALIGLLATLVVSPLTALGDDLSVNPLAAPGPIASIWQASDGPVASGNAHRGWLWGPKILSITQEPFADSPGGVRTVYYFDKARMEITDPNADTSSPWYVTNGLLVRAMISGDIQVGKNSYIQGPAARVPVAGDLKNNSQSPTYAALQSVASIGAQIQDHREASQVGQPITALLHADGSVDPNGNPQSGGVTAGAYDNTLGHNVANVFVQWEQSLSQPAINVLGYPLTDPYWIDATVGGKQKRILFQAFERRVLTYTPSNPAGWQVETGNVGLQYRQWLGLELPDNDSLKNLALNVPDGEILVSKATQYNVDPFLFVALAKVASNFNPLATMSNGGQGLLGVRLNSANQTAVRYPKAPQVNADLAASQLAQLQKSSNDWRAILASYYTGSANPNWSTPGLKDFVGNVLNTLGTMLNDYNHPYVAPTVTDPPATSPAPPTTSPSTSTDTASSGGNTPSAASTLATTGQAAYYSPSYDTSWWVSTLNKYASWGGTVAGWQPDPNGYYCVRPGMIPGQILKLTANGVSLTCTIGDTVAAGDVAAWESRWVVELSYNTFVALHLDQNNQVTVQSP